MDMAYSKNPNLPRVRMEAVTLVKYHGWSARQAARRFGFAHNTVLNWLHRQPEYGRYGRLVIPTRSSKPLHHPDELSTEIINRILELRGERRQCAEILHHRLKNEGILVSLSSVKRVLQRNHCTRFSKWKKWHQYPPRVVPLLPGGLVEIDSMLDGQPQDRLSAYALVDVYSRWACAWPVAQPNSLLSVQFIARAQETAPFKFQTVQSDHGSEFAKWFTKTIEHQDFIHRHSRVRTPTDNGHIERFIQTLQKECLSRIPKTMHSWQKEVPEFIRYYNCERPHMALDYQTPMQVVRSY